jgi:hypothetical protein
LKCWLLPLCLVVQGIESKTSQPRLAGFFDNGRVRQLFSPVKLKRVFAAASRFRFTLKLQPKIH